MSPELSNEERERIRKIQERLRTIKFTPDEIIQMQEASRELKKVSWQKLYQPFTI